MKLKQSRSAYSRALSFHNTHDFDAAKNELSDALIFEPDSSELLELLGIVLLEIEDFDGAQSAIEHASILAPISAQAQIVLAKCYDHSGYSEAAKAIYQHIFELPFIEERLLESLASGLGRYGDFVKALEVCRKAAIESPDSIDPLLGIVHYMRRLRIPVERILPTMFKAHHIDPENTDCRITLAWMLHECGRSEDGAYLLEQVLFEDFTCIRCLTLMQRIFESVGNTENAAICRNRLRVIAGEWPHPQDD